ncbi:hypothetical protein CANCADRAFT_61 [Tortispora caseinolytica NRRL Y-17796]|uniref:Uncharacterized protein n=1 Tax=Tortispora caseinolytica NRRL Y-17796 TaxID=767744 RepID=A0A1E4TIA2_9ASCO|nr:hypothetical protein CANCADRAFT_61 [Tortispora caseinolytica NRRL Y-17796]
MADGSVESLIEQFVEEQRQILGEPVNSRTLGITPAVAQKVDQVASLILDSHFDREVVKGLAQRVANLTLKAPVNLRGMELLHCANVLPRHVSDVAYNDKLEQLKHHRKQIKELRAQLKALERINGMVMRLRRMQLTSTVPSQRHITQLKLAVAKRKK